ncbi:MAG TPA: four-carbon acid sugar kinase family protein [Telmatospirillum sp.]|nr:four-carbon acid sugar kinase family protein [Telmatospirillum sp.]
MLPSRWLIIADDLTGAADCGIAFAKTGMGTMVSWGNGAMETRSAVLSVDADSRRLSAEDAARRHVEILTSRHRAGHAFYKKIDSTLRGQPAAELAAQLDYLARERNGNAPLAIVAPSFPGTGRTVVEGRLLLDGRPLEGSMLWARDHSYTDASLPNVLAGAGLRAKVLPLSCVREGAPKIAAFLADARWKGVAAVVCDAVEESDLEAIATGSLLLADMVVWVGSGGLAAHLARQVTPSRNEPLPLRPSSGHRSLLVVVGSVAEASRRQADLLVAANLVQPILVEADALFAGPTSPAWQTLAARLAEGLAANQDILLEIVSSAAPNLTRGAELAGHLAQLVAPYAGSIGGLIATGGDTACALLSHLGVGAIHLVDEVEAGVPIGITDGGLSIPVITKAGAFGSDETLCRCVRALKQG